MTDKCIEAKLNNKEVVKKLNSLAKKFGDINPFLKIIRVKLLAEINENFETEGISSGEKWEAWSEKYKKLRIKYGTGNGKILNLSGDLRRSFVSELQPNKLIIGTAKDYAAAHNFGYDKRNLPQREFMRFSAETFEELLEDLNDYAKELINKTI